MLKRMLFEQTAGETLWSAPSNEAPFSKNAASRKGSRVVVSFLVRRISILSATGWPAECRRGTSRKATMLVV
jgi:hypothetical protein